MYGLSESVQVAFAMLFVVAMLLGLPLLVILFDAVFRRHVSVGANTRSDPVAEVPRVLARDEINQVEFERPMHALGRERPEPR